MYASSAARVHIKEEDQDCIKADPSEDSALECSFCGEEMSSQEVMVRYYTLTASLQCVS